MHCDASIQLEGDPVIWIGGRHAWVGSNIPGFPSDEKRELLIGIWEKEDRKRLQDVANSRCWLDRYCPVNNEMVMTVYTEGSRRDTRVHWKDDAWYSSYNDIMEADVQPILTDLWGQKFGNGRAMKLTEHRNAGYVDTEGTMVSGLYFSRALKAICEICEFSSFRTDAQTEALTHLNDFLLKNHDDIDMLEPSEAAVAWPMNPEDIPDTDTPSGALKSCLRIVDEMIENASNSGMEHGDLTDAMNMGRQASEMCRDLIGLHEDTFNELAPAAAGMKP